MSMMDVALQWSPLDTLRLPTSKVYSVILWTTQWMTLFTIWQTVCCVEDDMLYDLMNARAWQNRRVWPSKRTSHWHCIGIALACGILLIFAGHLLGICLACSNVLQIPTFDFLADRRLNGFRRCDSSAQIPSWTRPFQTKRETKRLRDSQKRTRVDPIWLSYQRQLQILI